MESGDGLGGVWEIVLSGLSGSQVELFPADPSHPHPNLFTATPSTSFQMNELHLVGMQVHETCNQSNWFAIDL